MVNLDGNNRLVCTINQIVHPSKVCIILITYYYFSLRYLLQPRILGQEELCQKPSPTTHLQIAPVNHAIKKNPKYFVISNSSFFASVNIVLGNILDPSDTVTVKGGKFAVNIENGQPKIYYPTRDVGMEFFIIMYMP